MKQQLPKKTKEILEKLLESVMYKKEDKVLLEYALATLGISYDVSLYKKVYEEFLEEKIGGNYERNSNN